MTKRYYKAELLLEDSIDDKDENELGNGEMSTSEIAEILVVDLPYGFKALKKVVIKIAEGELDYGTDRNSS